MWDWFRRRKRVPETPAVSRKVMGEIRVVSGTLLLADPGQLYDPVRIEGVPPGQVPAVAEVIRYPEGGRRVAKVGLHFRPGEAESCQTLGRLSVDSGMAVALDARTYETCWKEVGPARVGRTGTPKEHRRVASLIGEKFGLRRREVSPLESEFLEPVSEELEGRITDYLRTFPEYADFPFMYFRVDTRKSFELVQECLGERLWGDITLDEGTGEGLLAFSSGFGDGSYPVEGLYRSGELVGAEVQFIGPAQEKVLEAFPVLRF
jgi:hypothetical protein